MSKFPSKPQKGDKVLQSIYDSLNEVIDYIPSLQIKGDNKTTSVSHSSTGTTIHANVTPPSAPQSKEGTEYTAGSGIQILSGTVLNAAIDNSTIKFGVKNGQYVLSCTLSGGGGGGPDTNDTYIGDANYYHYMSGNHVFVSPDADYNGSHLVSSTLHWLQELNNNKFCENARVTFPTTSHVITSDIGVNSDHCIVPGDLIHDGLGTTVNYSWMRSPFGDEPTAMVGSVNGLQVDLTLSGGKYADVVLYQNKGGYGTVSHETEPPTQSTINVLLSGDGDVNPATGHIFIRDVDYGNGTSGGIIYTDLQGGGSNIPTPEAGKILSCDNSGMTWQPNVAGGSGSGFIPDWGHSKHDFGVPPTTSKPQHPTVAEHDGYLFAWASFNPSQLGYCFQTAQAHIVVNDAWMKVCEVSYPDKFYIVVDNKKFQRYPYGDIIHQMMLTGTTAGSGDTTQTISPTLYYRNDGDDVWDDNNEYVQYHGWTASSRDEILPSKIFTQNFLLRPFNENWDIYFKKYNVYEYQNGQRGSWLTSYIDGYNIDVSQMLEDQLGYTGGWEQEAFFDQQWGLKGSAGNQIDRACWQYNGDYIYTNGSIDNGTETYELTQTGLDEKRQDYNYVGDVTDNNMKMQAIGVGGGLCVPFRKGAQLSYVVNMDGRAVNIPTNYGTSGMTWAPAACCIVYYNHST